MQVSFKGALLDISGGLKRYSLVGMLGWQDIMQRYRRSALGPFWLTLSMGVMILGMGLVFGLLFKAPMEEFWPFLAAGMILWTMISTSITEGCMGLIASEGIIKQLPLPIFVHILRVIWRNFLIFLHNLVIFPLVLIIVGKPLTWVALLSIPGMLLVLINLTWIALIVSLLCTRYRDLYQIIQSVLQMVFYITPIMWMRRSLPADMNGDWLLINPIYNLIEVVRDPWLGIAPTAMCWLITSGMAIVGWCMALLMYSRYRQRVAYWL